MIKILKLIVVTLLAMFFIWLFGFVLGFILNVLFIFPDVEIKYSMYRYSFSRPFPGYYLSGLLIFAPFFLMVYIVMMKFKSNVGLQKYSTIFIVAIYFLYGVLVFGGQFWHLPKLLKGDFQGWLTGEHADLYFSISSLIAVLLFAGLLKQNPEHMAKI